MKYLILFPDNKNQTCKPIRIRQMLQYMTARLAGLFVLGCFISSCSRPENLSIAGSTTVLPVISVAAERYQLANPGLSILVNAGGSGVGVNQLGNGAIDIGMISRNITIDEIASYPDVNFIVHAIGKDAVVPVVSSEIHAAGVTALSLGNIASIYLGEIQNWRELGGPDRDILVVDKEQSRGTRHVFMEAVMGDEEALAPGADLVLGSNNEEQTAIVQSDSAIGMLSHAWLNDDVVGLSVILGDGSIIEPTLANIINDSYPITRDLLLVTNGQPQDFAADFIAFIFSTEGQTIVEENGYVALDR